MAIKEYTTGDQILSNHARLKDREMQRAFDSKWPDLLPFLPTRSRMRRAHTTIKQLIKQNEDRVHGYTAGMPMQSS